jgi:hypothetical protein
VKGNDLVLKIKQDLDPDAIVNGIKMAMQPNVGRVGVGPGPRGKR